MLMLRSTHDREILELVRMLKDKSREAADYKVKAACAESGEQAWRKAAEDRWALIKEMETVLEGARIQGAPIAGQWLKKWRDKAVSVSWAVEKQHADNS